MLLWFVPPLFIAPMLLESVPPAPNPVMPVLLKPVPAVPPVLPEGAVASKLWVLEPVLSSTVSSASERLVPSLPMLLWFVLPLLIVPWVGAV
jgi:hypothetical protein